MISLARRRLWDRKPWNWKAGGGVYLLRPLSGNAFKYLVKGKRTPRPGARVLTVASAVGKGRVWVERGKESEVEGEIFREMAVEMARGKNEDLAVITTTIPGKRSERKLVLVDKEHGIASIGPHEEGLAPSWVARGGKGREEWGDELGRRHFLTRSREGFKYRLDEEGEFGEHKVKFYHVFTGKFEGTKPKGGKVERENSIAVMRGETPEGAAQKGVKIQEVGVDKARGTVTREQNYLLEQDNAGKRLYKYNPRTDSFEPFMVVEEYWDEKRVYKADPKTGVLLLSSVIHKKGLKGLKPNGNGNGNGRKEGGE